MTERKILDGSEFVYDIEPLLIQRAKEIAKEINQINLELEEIQEAIRLSQPAGDGSVLMYLNNCNKEGCLGCPHLKWKQWKVYRNHPQKPYYAKAIKGSPLRHIKRTGEYEDSVDELKELIKKAMKLYERRKLLLSKMRRNGPTASIS